MDLHDLGVELPRLQWGGTLSADNGAEIAFTAPNAETIEQIANFDISEFASALGGIALSLSEVVTDALVDFDIPFTDLSFEDAVDAGTAFAADFSVPSILPTQSLQDVLAVFADRFGATISYDAVSQQLHIPVDLALRIFRETGVDLGFAYDFGDLAGL